MAKAKKQTTDNLPATTTPNPLAVAWPIIPTRIEIAERCAPLEKRVKEVETLAAAFEAITAENAQPALDYLDQIRQHERSIEKWRTVYVEKPNLFVKTLNALVKTYSGRLEIVRKALGDKVLTYQRQIEAQAKAEAEKKRKEEAADAEKRAKKLERSGDSDGAAMLRDIVATAPAPKMDVKLRTETGVTSVVTVAWNAEILNMTEFLNALLGERLGREISVYDITIAKSALNAYAKAHQDQKDKVQFGMKITSTESLGTR